MIFCRANASQIRHIGALLVCFEAVAGLKVNLSKSPLVPVGSLDNVGQPAGLLGCGSGDVPLKYLGLPLGASFKLKAMWAGLEDLMSRRLAPWKSLYLSKGGRITLIKSTLSNMPTYTWRMVPLCVMWCLWRERNAQIFEDRELGLMELKKRVIQTLFSWRVLWLSPQVSTLAEFLDFCATFSSCFVGSFCILPVYMGCAPCAFNKLIYYI